MIARENSTSHNTKEITIIRKKPTLTNQRVQEGKQALQQHLPTSPEEGLPEEVSIHTAEMTAKKQQ